MKRNVELEITLNHYFNFLTISYLIFLGPSGRNKEDKQFLVAQNEISDRHQTYLIEDP
jgi:hypothetical protein